MRTWMTHLAVATLLATSACVTDGATPKRTSTNVSSAEPAETTGPDLGGRQALNAHLGIELTRVIGPGSPASVTGGRAWDEFQTVVANLSKDVVTIDGISLVDGDGVFVRAAASGYEFAPTYDDVNREMNEDMAVTTAIGAVSMFAGTFIPVPGAAQAASATGLLAPELGADAREAMGAAAAVFNERALKTPTTLDGGGTITGSVFFPRTPGAAALVVTYRVGTMLQSLRLSLRP